MMEDIRFVCDNGSAKQQIILLIDGSTTGVDLYFGGSVKLATLAAALLLVTLNATTDVTIDGKSAATTGKAVAMVMYLVDYK